MGYVYTARFAPSPNGYLHLGHAYSALLNQAFAQMHGAQLLLRIEDIDPGRKDDVYVAAILDDLTWLGLEWIGPVRQQSMHFDFYAQAISKLKQMGLVYPCFCTRKQIMQTWAGAEVPKDPDGAPLYQGTCKDLTKMTVADHIAQGKAHCWRLDMTMALKRIGHALFWYELQDWRGLKGDYIKADPAAYGDVVLVRKDVPSSYHLSSVLDDAHQCISHIIRGQDLYHATSVHRVLQALLDLPTPHYFHHALMLDDKGEKLAKSKGSLAIKNYRQTGGTLDALKRDLVQQGLL